MLPRSDVFKDKKKKIFSHDAQHWQIVLFNKNKDILNAVLYSFWILSPVQSNTNKSCVKIVMWQILSVSIFW